MIGNVIERSQKSHGCKFIGQCVGTLILVICNIQCLTVMVFHFYFMSTCNFSHCFISCMCTDACLLVVFVPMFQNTAARLKVKLQCCCVENNPIGVRESVIRSNPTTARKNRDHSGSESVQIQTHQHTQTSSPSEKHSQLHSISSTVDLQQTTIKV